MVFSRKQAGIFSGENPSSRQKSRLQTNCLGARKRRHRKRLDAAVQAGLHIPPRLHESYAGQKNVKSYYKFFAWLYPVGRAVYPAGFCTLREVGRAMIKAAGKGYPKQILEVKDIVKLANDA